MTIIRGTARLFSTVKGTFSDLKAERDTMRKKMLYQSAIAAPVGLIASVVFCLIVNRETVGGVALVVAPLFLVSIVLVFILELFSASNVVKLAAFVSPLVFVLGVTAYAARCDAQSLKDTGVCDGSGDVVRFMLKAYLIGLVIAFACLIALARWSSTPVGKGVEKVAEHSLGDEKNSAT